MPKIVVQTMVKATMNAAAEEKTGRQRAASHSNSGNNRATGTTVAQGSRGMKITMPLIAASTASATPPSLSSLLGGGSRAAEASPMSSGATATMPSMSDANQCCQMVRVGAVEAWNSL